MFSSRLPPGLSAEALHEPAPPPGSIDLSCGNPGRCGLAPSATVLPQLNYGWTTAYAPEPLGPLAARHALAAALVHCGAMLRA